MKKGNKKKAYSIFLKAMLIIKVLTGISGIKILKIITTSLKNKLFYLKTSILNTKQVLRPFFYNFRKRLFLWYSFFFRKVFSTSLEYYNSISEKLAFHLLQFFYEDSVYDTHSWDDSAADIDIVFTNRLKLLGTETNSLLGLKKPLTQPLTDHLLLIYKKKF